MTSVTFRWSSFLPGLTAALLHLAACVAFAEAGADARFSLAQPIASAAIAYVVVATLCWDWRVFGDLHLANFVGHLGFFAAVFFLVNCLFAPAPDTLSLLDIGAKVAQKLFGWLAGVPESVFDVIRSPGIAVLFLGVCLALVIPRRPVAAGVFVCISIFAVAIGLTSKAIASPGWMLGGLALMGSALWLQHHDPEETWFWRAVLDRFAGDHALTGDLELKARLLRRLRDGRAALSERRCLGLVARALGASTDAPEVREITARVVGQLIEQDHIAIILHTAEGRSLALSDTFDHSGSGGALRIAAGVPKAVVVGLLVLVWVLSPIDLIPDATPVVGALDDALAAILGAGVIYRAFAKAQGSREASAVFPTGAQ